MVRRRLGSAGRAGLRSAALQGLRRTLRPELLAESRKHKATKLLRQIPCIGPIQAACLLTLMQTPRRFRSNRQLWTYSGLGIETATARNAVLLADNCNVRKSRNRFVR